ncbi:TetR/AcrR family transcriptional regulator [Amycolatopsis tolypomycina]|uniref:Regulatory protein, tetR family n=1 Tax=Amycolatopsis tolypomycina TaxID=208445 RepID=A0A1H4TU00_9PSEU|nr:TetR/AcrR family transcriptional regulator [Amycolatopsis tolypomycina]SEC59983.1 regulatory protein, tetR family [Amycolatopsis tolypomycina]
MSGDDAETGLPASFELAWGVRDRPAKGPKRGLSLEQIVEAAIDVADAEGIGGVSMGRVAKELGASAMSLYRYLGSKDELLALMIDGAFNRFDATEPTGGTWRARLERWAEIELAAYRRFPWVLHIPITGAPIMPNQLRFMEWGLRTLGGTGLTEADKLSSVLLVTSFTRSFALLSSDIAAAFESADPTTVRLMPRYGELIRKLTTRAEFPALHAVVDAGTFDDGGEFDGLDHDFRFGLQRILDGIEKLIDRPA